MDITQSGYSNVNIGVEELKRITAVVKESHNIDFSHYAISSFHRRIVRIYELFKFKSLEELITKIKSDKVFFEIFLKEVTVNTTELFRDPAFWHDIRKIVIPELQKKPVINIWHAGCSSGEEPLSMAIMLFENNLLQRVKNFATDINTDVLKVAQSGRYPERMLPQFEEAYANYGGNRKLSDYYKIMGRELVFDPMLLQQTTYRQFDLVIGESFSKFDMIFCRNVMIYFDKVLQDRVAKVFHESLKPNGFYALGTKESMIWCSVNHLFKTVSIDNKIYQVR